MTGNGKDHIADQRTLRSRLSDLTQLSEWIGDLAQRYAIPGDVQHAMILCLEEALANVILHGYAGADDCFIDVRFIIPRRGYFEFIVDDEAPRFNFVDAPEQPALSPHREIRVGGQGIRLLRKFADVIEYEPTANGNRLRMGFSSIDPAIRTK